MKLLRWYIVSLVCILSASSAMAWGFTCNVRDSYEKIQRLYRELNAWGMELQLEVSQCDPHIMRSSPDELKAFVRLVCNDVDMHRPQLMIMHSDKEVAGYTVAVISEQGTLCGRIVNKNSSALFTILCNKPCNPTTIAARIGSFFETTQVTVSTTIKY